MSLFQSDYGLETPSMREIFRISTNMEFSMAIVDND